MVTQGWPSGLSDPVAKLRWGEYHLNSLKQEISDFRKLHPYEIIVEADDKALRYDFYVRGLVDAPSFWGLEHRGLLAQLAGFSDHLAFQLGQLRGTPLTEQRRTVMFPLSRSQPDFASNGSRRILMLRSEDAAMIRKLQPYNAWDTKIWTGLPSHLAQRLGDLDTLDIEDKHRNIHPVWQAINPLFETPSLPGYVGGGATGDTIENKSKLGWWSFEHSLPDICPWM